MLNISIKKFKNCYSGLIEVEDHAAFIGSFLQ